MMEHYLVIERKYYYMLPHEWNLDNIILSERSQSQKPCILHEMSRLGKSTERERRLGMIYAWGVGGKTVSDW